MNAHQLATNIHLSPRAIILSGTIMGREKKSESGPISGFTPHHAIAGVPTVPYDGDEPAPTHQVGACIECAFTEQNLIPSVANSYGRALNLVHLIFGNASQGPTSNELKVLREAGQILQANAGKAVYLASLPVLSAGQYGVAQGRHYVLGLFNADGAPLFLNPAAVDAKVLTAAYPQNQKTRNLQAIAPAPAPKVVGPSWYDAAAQAIGAFSGLKGDKLHKAVLEARAKQLGKEQSLKPKDAAAAAQKDYDTLKQASASPTDAGEQEPAVESRKSIMRARV